MAVAVILAILDKLEALVLIVSRILLLDKLLLLLKQPPLKFSHDPNVFFREARFVRALFQNLVAILVDLDGLAALVLESFGFYYDLEEGDELLLVLFDSALHA